MRVSSHLTPIIDCVCLRTKCRSASKNALHSLVDESVHLLSEFCFILLFSRTLLQCPTTYKPPMSNCLSLAVAAVVLLVLSTCTFGSVASTVCRQTGYEVAHLYSGKVRGRRQRCSISFKMDKR